MHAFSQEPRFGRDQGWAGPPNAKSGLAFPKYIIVDTFAKAVQSGDAAGSIKSGPINGADLRRLKGAAARSEDSSGRTATSLPEPHAAALGAEAVAARRRAPDPRAVLDREQNLGWMLMLPGLLLLVVFMAYPFFLGLWLSLTDSTIGHAGRFIGLANFTALLKDSIFQQTAKNTFIYALVTVPSSSRWAWGSPSC